MFDFCPHCGQTTDQEQIAGSMLVCSFCGQSIGLVAEVQPQETPVPTNRANAFRCAVCGQLVEVKPAGTLVPHYAIGARKICAGSGKKAV
jgi:transcription elongation factor Elf1